jgi:hypothetical protein
MFEAGGGPELTWPIIRGSGGARAPCPKAEFNEKKVLLIEPEIDDNSRVMVKINENTPYLIRRNCT